MATTQTWLKIKIEAFVKQELGATLQTELDLWSTMYITVASILGLGYITDRAASLFLTHKRLRTNTAVEVSGDEG